MSTGLAAGFFAAAALPLQALAAALAAVAGCAGLDCLDLVALEMADDARFLGGMALKSNLLYEHPEQPGS